MYTHLYKQRFENVIPISNLPLKKNEKVSLSSTRDGGLRMEKTLILVFIECKIEAELINAHSDPIN